MYTVLDKIYAGQDNSGGMSKTMYRVTIQCDTVAEMPDPEEHWAVGSTCEVLEDGGSKYRLSNAGEWVQVNFDVGGGGVTEEYVAQKIAEAQLSGGDASELEMMTVVIPVANEYKNGSTTGGIGGGSICRIDVTNYTKFQISIESEGTNSSFKLWFGPYGDTSVIAEIASNASKTVEIDCSGLSGEYELAFSITNCGRWTDITAQRIVGKDTVDAINVINARIDVSDFGKKVKLAEDFNYTNLVGWQKVATVSLTGVNVLSFTGEIFSVGNASHNIMIAPAGELPANSANEIFSDQLKSDSWGKKKFKVNVSAYSGNYDIYIVGGGAGYHKIRYSDISSMTPIQVDDIADALNYLLSLHN